MRIRWDCKISIQSLPNASDAQRESHCSTSSHLPVWLGQFTVWSWNIHRMEIRRASLLLLLEAGPARPTMKTYEDTVRAAVEEQFLPFVPVPVHSRNFFTIQLQNQTGTCWDCWFKAMYRQIWLADNSGENEWVQLRWSGKRSRKEFRSIKYT